MGFVLSTDRQVLGKFGHYTVAMINGMFTVEYISDINFKVELTGVRRNSLQIIPYTPRGYILPDSRIHYLLFLGCCRTIASCEQVKNILNIFFSMNGLDWRYPATIRHPFSVPIGKKMYSVDNLDFYLFQNTVALYDKQENETMFFKNLQLPEEDVGIWRFLACHALCLEYTKGTTGLIFNENMVGGGKACSGKFSRQSWKPLES